MGRKKSKKIQESYLTIISPKKYLGTVEDVVKRYGLDYSEGPVPGTTILSGQGSSFGYVKAPELELNQVKRNLENLNLSGVYYNKRSF